MQTLAPYTASRDTTISLMARMLTDIINTTDDHATARVFDSHASQIMEDE